MGNKTCLILFWFFNTKYPQEWGNSFVNCKICMKSVSSHSPWNWDADQKLKVLLDLSWAHDLYLYTWIWIDIFNIAEFTDLWDENINYPIGYVDEYPTMHYFWNPRHTQSMIAFENMILTEYFWKFRWKIALWECCWHALLHILTVQSNPIR